MATNGSGGELDRIIGSFKLGDSLINSKLETNFKNESNASVSSEIKTWINLESIQQRR